MLYSYWMAFMMLEGAMNAAMNATGTHRGQEIMKGPWEETFNGRGRHNAGIKG